MDLGSSVAGGTLTAAVVALIYGITKLMRRSQCQGHSGCCDIQIDREELERAQTERDDARQLVAVLMDRLNMGPEKETEQTAEQKSEQKEGEFVEVVSKQGPSRV